MLVYSEFQSHVHLHYIIMEMFDRTWSESTIFRNEYFVHEEDAYQALLRRGDLSRMYCVVPTVGIHRTDDYADQRAKADKDEAEATAT